MMGTSVCKQCVRYIDNCIPSSSSENGCTYILKDDEKHCDNKHRSYSIGADAPNATSSNNAAAGFWNSWESINTIRSKFEKDRTSRSAKVNSIGKMFGTKLSCSTSSKIGRECIPNNMIGNCEINRGYREIQQLGNTPSSNSYTDLQSHSNELENGKRQLHQGNLSGNYGANRIYPERQQSEITPSSSSSCGDIASSSNKSENGQIQFYQRNLSGNYVKNRIYPEIQQSESTPSSSTSCGDIRTSSDKSENGQIQLYQRNLSGNYATSRLSPEEQQSEITPSSSSSCGDIASSSNKSENGQTQLYQRNLSGNYATSIIYPERQQSEITPSSSSSCGDIASSNKSENGQIHLYHGNFVDALPSTSISHRNRTKRSVIGDDFVKPLKDSVRCHETLDLCESESKTSRSKCTVNSGNNCEESEKQFSTKVERSSNGAVPKVSTSNFVDALPSTSISHRNRTKRSVIGNDVVKPLKDSVRCHETLDLCESESKTPRSKCSVNSGNNCEESEKQFSTKVERSSNGAVPKVSTTSTFERQEDLQHHNQKHNNLPGEKGRGLGFKNMPAEVSVRRSINHGIEKDTGDNGCSFLNLTPPANLLATKEGRLKTYKNWPNKNIEPEKLAAAGFFYSGKTDIVECFKCGIKGHNWLMNDDPMADHKKWNRNCPFVRENAPEQNNVPQTGTGSDYCGNLDLVTSQYTVSEEPGDYYRSLGVDISPFLQTGARSNQSESHNLEGLLLRTRKGPSQPDQIIYERRLATFTNWPKSLKQKPADLAAAGFYYLGIGDQTLCFYCGGGLKDWVEEDDPWEQHALWFPECNYLLLKKTPAFVKDVQEKHKSELSSKQNETEVVPSCSSSNNSKESPSAVVEERERNNAEESSTLCKICYKNELAVVFLPCGHMVACVDCASGLKECAICRKEIQANVRAFLS